MDKDIKMEREFRGSLYKHNEGLKGKKKAVAKKMKISDHLKEAKRMERAGMVVQPNTNTILIKFMVGIGQINSK